MPAKKNKIDNAVKKEMLLDDKFEALLNQGSKIDKKIKKEQGKRQKIKEAKEKNVPLMKAEKAQSAKDYIAVLDYLGYHFKYNEISNDVLVTIDGKWKNYYEYDGIVKTDVSDIVSQYWEKELSNNLFDNAVKNLYQTDKNRFNPIIDIFNDLVWDEKPRYISFFKNFTDKHSITGDLFNYWMLGSIERLFNPNGFQNPVLILDGKQGVGKSSLVKFLSMPFEKYYDSGSVDPSNKDSRIALTSNFIFDWSEGSGFSKRETESLKDLLTKDKEKIRLPYGRKPIEKKIISNIIMTKNDTGSFLKDQTGNRRFNILKGFDVIYNYKEDGYTNAGDWYEFGLGLDFFKQLWAEAYYLWKYDKEKSWKEVVNNPSVRESLEASRTEALNEPALYETLDSFIVGRKGGVILVMDLYKKIEEIDRHFNRNKHYNIISDYFRHRHGVEKVRKRTKGQPPKMVWEGVIIT